jgi:tetratricopeptide (TPR) repeat protein
MSSRRAHSRIPIKTAFALLFLLVATIAHGDTLYLKSGMSITVTKAQEKDGKIEYWVGEDEYSIDKSEVVKIEHGDLPIPNAHSSAPPIGAPTVQDLTRREPAASTAPHDRLKLPLPSGPKQSDAYWEGLRNRIMVRDTIDDQRLAEIEIRHENRTTANAFYLAGVTALQRGNAEQASGYFEHAIQAMPEQVDLLKWHAIALAAIGKYPDAANELERATTLQPDSADLLRLLGLARYDADRTGDAVAAWRQAIEIEPDATTEHYLHKAERELQVEEKSKSKESRHFTLRYQGEQTAPGLRQQLLATLEDAYQDLSRQLGYEPRENIIVILYTQQQFEDITEAPSWAGALNDGKLRIPIGGVAAVDPELQRVLKHELTHSFLNSLASGRCPVWLNEGLAQFMEPRSASMYAQQLSPLFLQRKAIPFSILERSFTRFSPLQAQVAYAESLAAVEYLNGRYGMGEIVRMVQSIGSGVEPETALRSSTGVDYSVLGQRIGEYLARGQ